MVILTLLLLILQHEPIEQSLESFFLIIELTIHTPEWLVGQSKSRRCVDSERPLTYNELNFLHEMRHKEIGLMRGKIRLFSLKYFTV